MGILQRQEKDNVQVLHPSVVHIGIGDRERRLVKRLRSGDAGALQDFYALYSGSMSSVCGRYITDRDDMKDVLQECLIRIAEKIKDFEYRGPGSLRAWVTRIVINQSLKYLKARQAHEFARLDYDLPEEPEETEPPLNDIPPEVIYRMIRELPAGYRTIFNLYVFEEKSHQEIAELLGIKPMTSASQLFKAKNLLARRIREYLKQKS